MPPPVLSHRRLKRSKRTGAQRGGVLTDRFFNNKTKIAEFIDGQITKLQVLYEDVVSHEKSTNPEVKDLGFQQLEVYVKNEMSFPKQFNIMNIPLLALTDSYKAGHPSMYPTAKQQIAYGEFRMPFNEINKQWKEGIVTDSRIVFYGIQYIIDTYINKPITQDAVDQTKKFFSTHDFLGGKYDNPETIFDGLVGKYFPVKIEALEEGTVILPHTPVYKITAEGEYSHLVTFLETILTHVWYPSTVATLSRHCKQLLETAWFTTCGFVDADGPSLTFGCPINLFVPYQMHDFGFRGCTGIQQSVIGGVAHLLNFVGSDTISAAYYAQFNLNGGKRVAESIPATEHSVMTSFNSEADAFEKMIKTYLIDAHIKVKKPLYIVAMVMDSYDYERAIYYELPTVLTEKIGVRYNNISGGGRRKVQRGGLGSTLNVPVILDYGLLKPLVNDIIAKKTNFKVVLRPDSGDATLQVVNGLIAGCAMFGYALTKTDKGSFITPLNCAVIQGDGININTLKEILETITMNDKLKEFKVGAELLTQYFDSICARLKENNTEVPIHIKTNVSEILKLIFEKGMAFSPGGVAFGMGGGLLQKVNRDTMSFATKLCSLTDNNDIRRIVMKKPQSDILKYSIPGDMDVIRPTGGGVQVISKIVDNEVVGESIMKPYFDGVELNKTMNSTLYDPYSTSDFIKSFDAIKTKLNDNWAEMEKYKTLTSGLSPTIKKLQHYYEPSLNVFKNKVGNDTTTDPNVALTWPDPFVKVPTTEGLTAGGGIRRKSARCTAVPKPKHSSAR